LESRQEEDEEEGWSQGRLATAGAAMTGPGGTSKAAALLGLARRPVLTKLWCVRVHAVWIAINPERCGGGRWIRPYGARWGGRRSGSARRALCTDPVWRRSFCWSGNNRRAPARQRMLSGRRCDVFVVWLAANSWGCETKPAFWRLWSTRLLADHAPSKFEYSQVDVHRYLMMHLRILFEPKIVRLATIRVS
jgi:hypothetical protein